MMPRTSFNFYVRTLGTSMDRTLQIAVRVTETEVQVRLWERHVYQRHRNAEGHARNLTLEM